MKNPRRVIVHYSGGLVSWAAANRAAEMYGRERIEFLFTDTIIEHEDLYRFLLEGIASILGITVPSNVMDRVRQIPPVRKETIDARKVILAEIRESTNVAIPALHWVADGRTPWEVFVDERFVGNSRIDPCSRLLKRELMDQWSRSNCQNWDTVHVFGLDWSERGRIEGDGRKKPGHRRILKAKGWFPVYPMDSPPYLTKPEIIAELHRRGIEEPLLYKLGYPHNNCGGFCCKMGLTNANHLLVTIPKYYEFCEDEERRVMGEIGKTAHPVMHYQENSVLIPITLEKFRERQEKQLTFMDLSENGWGCGGGCAIDDGSDLKDWDTFDDI